MVETRHTGNGFDASVGLYESLVDWPRRLANEAPFFRRMFERHAVQRVLDVACGTGHHAAMFCKWGLEAEGADVSPKMLDRCRALHGEHETLRWRLRSYDLPSDPPGQFDAVLCIGNSLALVPDAAAAQRVIDAMMASLRPGGVCIVQVLNLWRIPEGPTLWQKVRHVREDHTRRVIAKGIHRVGSRGYVDLVDIRLREETLDYECENHVFLGIAIDELLVSVDKHGGTPLEILGGYSQERYDPQRSVDLILTVRRND